MTTMYDDFDDVLDMVNRNYQNVAIQQAKREEEARVKREKEIDGAVWMIDRALERSIKEEEWEIKMKKAADERAEDERKKRKATVIAVLIAAGLISPFAIKAGQTIIQKYEHWKDVNAAVSYQMTEATDLLRLNNLAYMSYQDDTMESPFIVRDNSVQDYKVLNVTDIGDVYAYKKVLPEEEFKDFIRSLRYTDETGTYGYTDFEHFLRINGFPDERTFDNYAREKIYAEHLQKQSQEQISTTQNNGKGGRN